MTDPSDAGLLDFCPRCRIQAPHRPGRDSCPRCHGALSVIAPGSASNRAPSPTPMRARQMPTPPPLVKPQPTTRKSPADRPRQRVFRNPNIRWTAQRPPEARPAPRTAKTHAASPTPRYGYIPQWGLGNLAPHPRDADETPRAVATRQLRQTLTATSGVFAITAFVHLMRYILVSVNRTIVVPAWADRITVYLVLFAGVCAVISVAVTVVAVARWLIALRADKYRSIGRVDPRPWWQIWPAVVIPVVNLIGPAWLVYEVAGFAADDATLARRQRALVRIWVAWVIVNVLAAVAIGYQLAADSLQNQADGLFVVTISAAVSAVFCYWLRRRLPELFDAPRQVVVESKTRWVIAG